MKSLVLVIERRKCQCGATFLAPNPRPLSRRELLNLRGAHILLPSPNHHTPQVHREIVHIKVDIECCPRCFETFNGFQLELFPHHEPPPLIFTQGKLEEQPPKKTNPFALDYF